VFTEESTKDYGVDANNKEGSPNSPRQVLRYGRDSISTSYSNTLGSEVQDA
jgi:hypothetical protein